MKATKEEMNVQTAKKANAKKRKRRRHGRYTLHYILIGIFVFAAGIVLSLTVFFKIEGVDVSGNTKYLNEQIIEIANVPVGENMFTIEKLEIEERVLKSFTYIDEVKVKYRLPPRVVIDITEAVPMAYVKIDDTQYAILSDKGKILEICEETPPDGEALVVGLNLEGMVEGEQIDKNNTEAMKMLSYVDKALEETALEGITRIDVSDRLNIRLLHEDRIVIELGTEGELAYKMKFADYALKNSIEENFEGVIDASIAKEVRIRATKLDENKNPIKNLKTEIIPEESSSSEGNTSSSTSSSSQSSSSSQVSSVAPSQSSQSSSDIIPSSSSSNAPSGASSSSSGIEDKAKDKEIPEVTPIGPGHDIKTG